MSEQFEMVAKTFQGLEEILAEELTTLGANDIQIGRRMISSIGDKCMMYKANFCLRAIIRILEPIRNLMAKGADKVYNQIQATPWEEYLNVNKMSAIDVAVFSKEFRHSKFVSYKVKDTIVDYFREKTGKRPSVRINNPGVLLDIHIAHTTCTLSLDSSGESPHRCGYRQGQVDAPLDEVLTAGILLMTGWRGECDLTDPMCGSGTIPMEAVLIARNTAPGVFRKGFAFEKWMGFNPEMFDEIYNDDSWEREFTYKIYGYDNNPKTSEIATHNIEATGASKDVTLKLQPFQQFEQPQEKSIIVMNPPYGERVSTNDLLGLHQMIGERLKHAFVGNEAWVLSYREECFGQVGLKPSKKVSLFNGALGCEFRKYEIFDGRYKEFKSQEGEGEEKKEAEGNYDTPRPRERKEFRPRREGEFRPRREDEFKLRREGEFKPCHEGKFKSCREGEYKPRREGELRPRKEGDFKPRREEGSFTRDDRDKKPRDEFRGERDSRAPREFRGNRGPRIPKKEEE